MKEVNAHIERVNNELRTVNNESTMPRGGQA